MRKKNEVRDKMKTSIIICTYNEEETIANIVISCCNNNPDSEIIVVDDGSLDNTENILNKLAKDYTFRYEKLEENKGKSWAMVYGVEISTNEVILFLTLIYQILKRSILISY